jgi:putative peptidoglycan lipid II flippase
VSGTITEKLPVERSARWRTLVNTLIVMGGVLLSRLLGIVREASIYQRFPPESAELNAYVAAFRVPDFLYAVIVGGALASTLIPVFQQVWHDEGEERAWQVASSVITLVLIILAIVLGAVALATPWLVGALYPEVPLEQQRLIGGLTRLFLLSPLLLGLGGIAMALLNARERFGLPALAFNVYNVLIIVGALVLAPVLGIWGIAYGLVVGAGLYVLVQVPGLARAGMRFTPRVDPRDPAVRRIGRQILPRLVGQSAVQINFIAMTSFALLLPTFQAAPLNAAYQLMLLPHGIFAMSLVTVLFPQMANLFARGEFATFRETVLRAVRMVVFVTMPIAMALAVLRVPVIRLLWERGAFDAHNTALVAAPLLIYLTSIVAFSVSEPLIRSFYAMQDTRTPVAIAVATVALNIALGYGVVRYTDWGAPGLALAFSISNNLEALALILLLLPRIGGFAGSGLIRSFGGALLCTLVMGIGLWGFRAISSEMLPMITLAGAYGTGADALRLAGWLALAGLLAVSLYLGMAVLLRLPEPRAARDLLRRRRTV